MKRKMPPQTYKALKADILAVVVWTIDMDNTIDLSGPDRPWHMYNTKP